MWHRVDLVWTDVSEKHIAFIFRVEKSASEEPPWAGGCTALHSETSVHTRSTLPHIPEDAILHSHRRENLKSYISLLFRSKWNIFIKIKFNEMLP
jgi:hypothetical protein